MLEMHLDPLGGVAGDMFVAGLLHLRPDLEACLARTISLCPLIDGVSANIVQHDDGILTGRRFVVSRDEPSGHGRHHDHAASPHDHGHTDWRRIRDALTTSALDRKTVQHAIAIFSHLAAAEARVHGVDPEAVRFHEVGAWDSITDIVAAAGLIAQIDAVRWTLSPLPLGSGRVRTAHGLLPVPAPATAILLEGFPVIDDGVGGERVTPTGAAIVRHLCDPAAASRAARRLVGSGHGFGARKIAGLSNCLRVLAFETIDQPSPPERVAVLECEIDDQTGEELAQAIDILRGLAGVLDIVQAPVFGKKGRMMTHLRVLAEPSAHQDVLTAIFEETTTIGIRYSLVARAVLPRRAETVDVDGRAIRRKLVERPSGWTAKVEADDLIGVAGQASRTALRRRAEEESAKDEG